LRLRAARMKLKPRLFPFTETMARPSLRIAAARMADPPVTVAHLLLLVYASIGAVVWGGTLIVGARSGEFEQYLLLLGFLGLSSAVFIFTRVQGNHVGIFYLPVFLTIIIFVRFGLVPVECFLDAREFDPEFAGRYDFLLRALEYIIIGMFAFWAGCVVTSRAGGAREPQPVVGLPQTDEGKCSVLVWSGAMYSIVFAIQVYLLHAHLYSYVGTWQAYYAHLASLQVLQTVSTLGGAAALILATIERYLHPNDLFGRWLFRLILAAECVWGLASGMKEGLLGPFMLVAMISSLIQRKFNKGWIAAALIMLVIVYPFTNRYRQIVLKEGGLSSVSEVSSTALKALSETQRNQAGTQGWLESGWRLTVSRMDMLSNFGLVLWLGPRATALEGSERWWMAPYYPFIPRFIWHSKPILNKGSRFSVATGSTPTSSRAITYPGDLYATYGLPGLLVGMFLLGIMSQWLAGTIGGAPDGRRLFIYAAMFSSIWPLETDAFSYWTGLIKSFVILHVAAFMIYGPRLPILTGPSALKKPTRHL
jgi:hypothetical protein